LVQRGRISLSDSQVWQLVQSRRIDNSGLQQALSQKLQLPWWLLERWLGVV
jgi:hypothetical protein